MKELLKKELAHLRWMDNVHCHGIDERFMCLSKIVNAIRSSFSDADIAAMVEAGPESVKIMPCEVGDQVKVDVRTWGNVWNYKTIECGKFLVGEIIAIIITKKQTLMKIQVEHNVSWRRARRRYSVNALGKTVFLTPEAAAAVLEGAEQC